MSCHDVVVNFVRLLVSNTNTQTSTLEHYNSNTGTAMNDQSSRSHMVLFDLVMKRPLSEQEMSGGASDLLPVMRFDLLNHVRGFSRFGEIEKDGATGKTRKEGIDIIEDFSR